MDIDIKVTSYHICSKLSNLLSLRVSDCLGSSKSNTKHASQIASTDQLQRRHTLIASRKSVMGCRNTERSLNLYLWKSSLRNNIARMTTENNDNSVNSRFAAPAATAEDVLKEQTLGLVQLSDFRKRRAEAYNDSDLPSGSASPISAA